MSKPIFYDIHDESDQSAAEMLRNTPAPICPTLDTTGRRPWFTLQETREWIWDVSSLHHIQYSWACLSRILCLQGSSPPLQTSIHPTGKHPNFTTEGYFYLYYVNRIYIFSNTRQLLGYNNTAGALLLTTWFLRLLSPRKLKYEAATLPGSERRRSFTSPL